MLRYPLKHIITFEVCGVYLRCKAVTDLSCNGYIQDDPSQHQHDCLMIQEAARIASSLYTIAVNLCDNKLQIREIFGRTTVVELLVDLSKAFKDLGKFEEKYRHTPDSLKMVQNKAEHFYISGVSVLN